MRWHDLFDDLEAQLEALETGSLRAEVAEHTRAERGRVELVARLLAGRGAAVSAQVRGAGRLHGTLEEVAPSWFVLSRPGAAGPGRVLVHLPAVLSLSGLGHRSAADPGTVARRLDLRQVLRALSRDRSRVRLVDVDGSSLAGRIEWVGSDHLDVAVLPDDGTQRGGARLVTLPYAAVATVQQP